MPNHQVGMFSVSPHLLLHFLATYLIPSQNLGSRLLSHWKWLYWYSFMEECVCAHRNVVPVLMMVLSLFVKCEGAHSSTCVLWVSAVPISRVTGWQPASLTLPSFPQSSESAHSPALPRPPSPLTSCSLASESITKERNNCVYFISPLPPFSLHCSLDFTVLSSASASQMLSR